MEPADDPTLLTPDELVDYQLKRATRGYAVAEVDALLDVLAAQTERLMAEVADAEQRAAARSREIEQLRARLEDAERAAEQAVAAAREVADAIVAEARADAEQVRREGVQAAHEAREAVLRQVRAEEADLRRRRRLADEHVESLRQFAEDHRARLQQHLRHELGRLEDLAVPEPPAAADPGRDPLLDEPLDALVPLDAHHDVDSVGRSDAPPGEDDTGPGSAFPGSASPDLRWETSVQGPRSQSHGALAATGTEESADADEPPEDRDAAGLASPFDEALFVERERP